MKKYVTPEIEIIALDSSDVLTESVGAGDNEGGWGDW